MALYSGIRFLGFYKHLFFFQHLFSFIFLKLYKNLKNKMNKYLVRPVHWLKFCSRYSCSICVFFFSKQWFMRILGSSASNVPSGRCLWIPFQYLTSVIVVIFYFCLFVSVYSVLLIYSVYLCNGHLSEEISLNLECHFDIKDV